MTRDRADFSCISPLIGGRGDFGPSEDRSRRLYPETERHSSRRAEHSRHSVHSDNGSRSPHRSDVATAGRRRASEAAALGFFKGRAACGEDVSEESDGERKSHRRGSGVEKSAGRSRQDRRVSSPEEGLLEGPMHQLYRVCKEEPERLGEVFLHYSKDGKLLSEKGRDCCLALRSDRPQTHTGREFVYVTLKLLHVGMSFSGAVRYYLTETAQVKIALRVSCIFFICVGLQA